MLTRTEMIRYIRGEGDCGQVVCAPNIGGYARAYYHDECNDRRHNRESMIRLAEEYDFSLIVGITDPSNIDNMDRVNPALRIDVRNETHVDGSGVQTRSLHTPWPVDMGE